MRPERMGLKKVAEVPWRIPATPSRPPGQTLARLTLPEGSSVAVQAPVAAGTISATTATLGAMASAKGKALFSIIARSEYDLDRAPVPTRDIAKLAVNQTARIKIIGAGDVDGKVRRMSTVQPDSQLGQVFIGITTNRRLLVNSCRRARSRNRTAAASSPPSSTAPPAPWSRSYDVGVEREVKPD